MALTARQEEIKQEFIRVRGTWSDTWEGVLQLDPEFLKAYLDFSAVPWRKNHLDDKVKEFVYIAIDANATHMYLPGCASTSGPHSRWAPPRRRSWRSSSSRRRWASTR